MRRVTQNVMQQSVAKLQRKHTHIHPPKQKKRKKRKQIKKKKKKKTTTGKILFYYTYIRVVNYSVFCYQGVRLCY